MIKIFGFTSSKSISPEEEGKIVDNRSQLFSGKRLNNTENRAVLHTALRNFSDKQLEGAEIASEVKKERLRIKDFCNSVHSGEYLGFTGKKIKNIVNIGIGGSDLGPAMVVKALAEYKVSSINTHFINNIDQHHVSSVLNSISIEETLFVVVSKTFTTQETITNANLVKDLLVKRFGNESVPCHFACVSANVNAAHEFGASSSHIFRMWDWVGGRFSLWSAAGITIPLSIGYDNYELLLRGAFDMDMHFLKTPLIENIPVNIAWNTHLNVSKHNIKSEAYIPYDDRLSKFVEWYQQLAMESNGKHVDRNGRFIDYPTSPVIWGGIGTYVQHSFFQFLHQGSLNSTSSTFIIVKKPAHEHHAIHSKLINNAVAQIEALKRGRSMDEVDAQIQANETVKASKTFPGNRKVQCMVLDDITPFSLGRFIAMWEHVVFVNGVLWNINSFDQFGVELGKELAMSLSNGTDDSWSDMSNEIYHTVFG